MNSIESPRAWQLAPVSRRGRVTSFALVALAVDAILARAAFPSAWIVAAIATISLIVAIRVARGFSRSLAAAAATFAAAGAAGLMSAAGSLVPVAMLGIVSAILAVQRERATPSIELTRTNRDGPEPATVRR
jgi:hypothetical protein